MKISRARILFQILSKIKNIIASGIAASATGSLLATTLFISALATDLAAEIGPHSGEPMPRFASLKADLVYLRKGPGKAYAIEWELTRRNMPVLIFGEYGPWRRVRLHDGDEGWIHRAMLTGRRYVAIQAETATLYEDPKDDARPLAETKPGLIMRLNDCEGPWCSVEIQRYRGWIKRNALWGVDAR